MILLATDLDETLVGDDESMHELLEKLKKLRKAKALRLVYATGRSFVSYNQLKEEKQLSDPDALVCSVGTELYISPQLRLNDLWTESFNTDWDRSSVMKFCFENLNLSLQPDSEQRPYKISFENKVDSKNDPQSIKSLLDKSFPFAEVLISHGNKFIDIIPKNSDKAKAIKFFANTLGLDQQSVIYAGDSLNDISMLVSGRSIVVGNAYQEVRDWFDEHIEFQTYFATANYASGIDEGLDYHLGKNWGEL